MTLGVEDLSVHVGGRSLFDHVSLTVPGGTVVGIMGPSGSGKTSLLHVIAGLLAPASGVIRIGETEVTRLSGRRRARHRLHRVGMVFQDADLLPELSVLENVELPGRILGQARTTYRAQAERDLDLLGIADRSAAWPGEISGGERQRAAIARALNNQPDLLLADEPTGALDRKNAQLVARLLREVAQGSGAAVVVATHDETVAGECDVVHHAQELSGTVSPV